MWPPCTPPPPAVLRSLNIVDLPASHCPFPPPSPFKETPFYVRYFTHIQLVHRRITNSSWFPSVSSPRGRALPLPLLHFRTLSPRAPSPILHSHKENPKTAAATAWTTKNHYIHNALSCRQNIPVSLGPSYMYRKDYHKNRPAAPSITTH